MSIAEISDRVGFTKPPHGSPLFFVSPVSVRKVDQKVSTTTVSNSTAETLLASFSVPALTHINQGGSAATISGTLRNANAAGRTVTIRSRLVVSGSTLLVAQSSAIALSTSVNSRHFQTSVALLGTTLSTQLRSWSDLSISKPTTGSLTPTTATAIGTRTIIVPNSSASATLKFTAQLSAASTALSASALSGWLETVA